MSQQLQISSLFCALALVTLALFARADGIAQAHGADASLVQAEQVGDFDA